MQKYTKKFLYKRHKVNKQLPCENNHKPCGKMHDPLLFIKREVLMFFLRVFKARFFLQWPSRMASDHTKKAKANEARQKHMDLFTSHVVS